MVLRSDTKTTVTPICLRSARSDHCIDAIYTWGMIMDIKQTCNDINTYSAESAKLDMTQAYIIVGAICVWILFAVGVWVLV